jgi:ribosomal protein S18 acetylase RimI-like enzyme
VEKKTSEVNPASLLFVLGGVMDYKLKSVTDAGLEATVDVLNEAFSDYFVEIVLTLPHFLQMMVQESIDAASSRVVVLDDKPVGVGLIARRGWSSRLAAMGVIPAARAKGAGGWLMEQLISEAKARGEKQLFLEVIDQNEAAVRLYQGCGFQTIRRLVGYKLAQPENGEKEPLQEIDIRAAAQMVTTFGLPNLPWQLSGESLMSLSRPNRAYQLDGAVAVITDPDEATIKLRSLIVKPEVRRQGQATKLLRGLLTKYPNKEWAVPVQFPEEMGGMFESLNFEQVSMSQFQMELVWE